MSPTIAELVALKDRGQPIVMVTAYDAPSARLADAAGVDVLLVGDSAAMTVLGYNSVLPVTLAEMLMLTAAVARSVTRPLVVADMPVGSYEPSDAVAVEHALAFARHAGAGAVKLEGAGPSLSRVRAIVAAGVPVMGHVGLTPQSAEALGGYKAQGRTAVAAARIVDDALALEAAGCFAVVVEAVPAPVATRITDRLRVPTIGIGAGPHCGGQVLVWHDLMGLTAGHVPRFVRRYADLAGATRAALEAYAADVRAGRFPAPEHTYAMEPGEERKLI